MKFAAFISIIISVAVMLAPAKAPSVRLARRATRVTRVTRDDWYARTPGINALLATNTPGVFRVSDKPGATPGATPVFGGTPAPFSIADHFIGGAGDRTHEKTANAAAATEYFAVAVAADGMVTLTVRDATPSPEPADMDGEALATFTVTATDANNITADKEFSVLRNIAPTAVRATYPGEPVIGTQDVVNPLDSDVDINADAIALRPNLNEYVITLDPGTAGNITMARISGTLRSLVC